MKEKNLKGSFLKIEIKIRILLIRIWGGSKISDLRKNQKSVHRLETKKDLKPRLSASTLRNEREECNLSVKQKTREKKERKSSINR